MVPGALDVITARGVTLQVGDLLGLSRLRGNVNRRDVEVDGVPYEAGSLVFKGFSGEWHDDGLCTGEYRFRHAQPGDDDSDMLDFTALPSWPTAVIVLP